MIIYYAISPRRKYEAIYSPQEFIVYSGINRGLPKVHWGDPFFIEIDSRFFDGKLSIDILEDAGWIIREINLSSEYSVHYRRRCIESQRNNDPDIVGRTLVTFFASLLPQVDELRHNYLNRPRLKGE